MLMEKTKIFINSNLFFIFSFLYFSDILFRTVPKDINDFFSISLLFFPLIISTIISLFDWRIYGSKPVKQFTLSK